MDTLYNKVYHILQNRPKGYKPDCVLPLLRQYLMVIGSSCIHRTFHQQDIIDQSREANLYQSHNRRTKRTDHRLFFGLFHLCFRPP